MVRPTARFIYLVDVGPSKEEHWSAEIDVIHSRSILEGVRRTEEFLRMLVGSLYLKTRMRGVLPPADSTRSRVDPQNIIKSMLMPLTFRQ